MMHGQKNIKQQKWLGKNSDTVHAGITIQQKNKK